ncbi:MAG: hypothetical protein KDB90_08460 [Planctomycetes bacterium]|nr:hypothetical protein [Planctomycetota bacterium]
MRKSFWMVAAVVMAALFALPVMLEAQRGTGKGGNKGGYKGPNNNGKGNGGNNGANKNSPWGKGAAKQNNLPSLQIEDVKPDGAYEVYNLLPTSTDQPMIGVTADKAYRLVGYTKETRNLKFVTLDMITGALGTKEVKLPTDAPDISERPRMAADGGQFCVVSEQAATIFVDPFKGKVKVACGYDSAVPVGPAPAPKEKWGRGKDKDKGGVPAEEYQVHGGADGRYALSVLVKYDKDSKQYTGSGATVHFEGDRSVTLNWDHATYGVPPKDRDAVCAVTDDEIVVLTTLPKTPGAFSSGHKLFTLVFDRKGGSLKEAQTDAEHTWHGGNSVRFTLSPDGKYLVAHREDGMYEHLIKRGSFEQVYKCTYINPCVGFTPDGSVGVFLESNTPQLARIKAIKLETLETIWETNITHKQAAGDGNDRMFTSVGPGATAVAALYGIIRGETADSASWLYRAEAVDFEPIAMSYDEGGKYVAVLALDRVFVLEAKSREEVNSIPFEAALPAGTLGEFIRFDAKAKKLMACARNKGVWIIDLATNTIEKTLPPVPGTWARAMPDFSGVLYSQSKDEGGNVMVQKLDGSEPERIYRCEYKDSMAVCYWISDKCDEFLIAERDIGEGRLFLVDEKGEVEISYDVADVDPTYVGDTAITGFVTKKKQAVLINEFSKWSYTGINCTVISPSQDGDSVETSFSVVFKSEDLPGRSTYGATAASPFFGGLFAGDERNCKFACPAGVLDIDVGKNTFKLYAWSRSPKGLTALNPKGKEFFVAGSAGLTTYKVK